MVGFVHLIRLVANNVDEAREQHGQGVLVHNADLPNRTKGLSVCHNGASPKLGVAWARGFLAEDSHVSPFHRGAFVRPQTIVGVQRGVEGNMA